MSNKLERTLALIDAANQEDPQLEAGQPRAYLYSVRMSETLQRFQPTAGEALQIAVRAQHIRRWQIPRSDYPAGRIGYLTWRRDLGQFHARETEQLMLQTGYGQDTIEEVKRLLTKQGLKHNPATQTLEDVACLVFIRYYLEDFAAGQEPEKLLGIIRKTWKKMSSQAQSAALALQLTPATQTLLDEALRP